MDPVTLSSARETHQILDVRDPYEWHAGRIDGAVHIPLQQLPVRLDEVDRGRPVAVVCRSGSRSALATNWLRQQGVDAYNVHGGVVAWSIHGLPLVSEDGRQGRVA
jgi:rhodanese-related sulfurtransferase